MKLNEIMTTEEAREGFFPTPQQVADKLLEGVDWWKITNILEPSAGKGNLVERIAEQHTEFYYRDQWHRDYRTMSVDCVEIDPHLRSVLAYEFTGARRAELQAELRALREKENAFDKVTRTYGTLTPIEKERKKELDREISKLEHTECRIVHDDFLTFDTRKVYDLIVMNPPFSNGDAHLLKAIEMMRRFGGEIRCILNAETLRNPYTNRRQLLLAKLTELGAEVSFLENAFSDAERKTDVTVAIIKISIQAAEIGESHIYERLRKAAEVKEAPPEDVTDLTVADFLEQIVTRFNVEVDAGLELLREYKAMQPYIMRSLSPDDKYNKPNLTLRVGDQGSYDAPDPNKFIRLTRKKYWEALFTNKEFVGKLTSNLRDKYHGMVDELQDYDFTLFNIQQIMVDMNAEMSQGIQDTIVALFDRMTAEHSWFPECAKNKHYYDGWKTNKAHKIGGKVILPVNGMFSCYSWDKDAFNLRNAENTIADIEKVFEYLDGNMSAPVDLHGVLERAHDSGQTKNIHCKFFSVTLYKKGTMHIKFHSMDLVERFNIYCSQKKNWLPPNYGRTAYADMSREAQAVVDGFNGNGAEGSGAAAYAEIMKRQGYFLSEPGGSVLALPGA